MAQSVVGIPKDTERSLQTICEREVRHGCVQVIECGIKVRYGIKMGDKDE